jgi:hypothetical protein
MFSLYGVVSSEVRQRNVVKRGLCILHDDGCVTINE